MVTKVLMTGGLILLILITVLTTVIIAEWKTFKKAGKKGWEAIVPLYNTWTIIEIAGLNWWYFLILIGLTLASSLSFIFTLASYYINFIIYYNIGKKTRQNEILYGILGIFVPFVPTLIIGFSQNITYDKNIEVSPNGLF